MENENALSLSPISTIVSLSSGIWEFFFFFFIFSPKSLLSPFTVTKGPTFFFLLFISHQNPSPLTFFLLGLDFRFSLFFLLPPFSLSLSEFASGVSSIHFQHPIFVSSGEEAQ